MPGRQWVRAWLAALALVLVCVSVVELWWRDAGHRPTALDGPDLWSYYRARIADRDPSTVVFLGGSRMQLDLDTERFRLRFPGRRIAQLAIDGSQPAWALRDLALDDRFRGVVVADMTAYGLGLASRETQRTYVEHYHERATLNAMLNSRLSAEVRGRLAILSPHVELLKVLRAGALPPPFYLTTKPDRSRQADFRLVDLEEHRAVRAEYLRTTEVATSPGVWLAQTDSIDAWVRAIQARGGRVAFVRLPSSGESWAYTRARYPRALYWDRFATRTPAATLHFEDVPAMAELECPDGSHLDMRDTPAFTDALADELRALGVL